MPDQIYSQIEFPEIPESFDEDVKKYLRDLQAAISDLLTGHVSIAGDLHVDGYIYMQGENRIRTFIP